MLKYLINKKTISPVVATALLLVVAVVGFQGWFQTYSSGLFSKVEQDSSIDVMNTRIDTVLDNNLYFKNGYNNLTITEIKLNDVSCLIDKSYGKGMQTINISGCVETHQSTAEVIVVTNKGLFTKTISIYNDGSSSEEGQDTMPDNFNFNNEIDVELDTLIESNTLTPTNYEGPLSVSITGDGNPQLNVNSSSWKTSATMNSGDNLTIKLNSSSNYNTTKQATLTLGDYSTIWSVKTKEEEVSTPTVIETDGNFELLSNGVVNCSSASFGDTGTLDGVTYTAVSNQDLSDKIESDDVNFYETACTSLVTTMNLDDSWYGGVFYNSNINPNILHWDTSSVTNMRTMFSGANSFNQPLDNFDTSSVTDMSYMFFLATSFNQSLNFDTSSVTNMSYIFGDANSFNQPLNFDTSSVTDMSGMFYSAYSFNQPLDNFDTSSVTDMSEMFYIATSFNQSLNFDTSSVTDMSTMFQQAYSFNQPLNFDTSSVTDMSEMFYYATSFNQSLNFDTSSVTDMSYMFSNEDPYTSSFNQPLNFNTSSVTDMSYMFFFAESFNQSLNFTDTSSVTDMEGMFYYATSFNQDISFWCVPHISSKPSSFDTDSGFEGQTALQPDWGNCP
ncbi:MAG: BspA family leucine-rich repeat surface protein [Nanoarchaeota archaeon]